MMKFLQLVLTSALFLLNLIVIYLIHVWFFPVQVIFYSAILDGVLAAALTGLLVFGIFRRKIILTGFERFLTVAIWLLCAYAIAISVPTVLDRSLSFYILEKIQQRGGGVKSDALQDIFVNEYIPEFRLMDVRRTEQLQSGTVVLDDGCLKLTPWGNALASFSRYFRMNLLAKHRLLAGEYTDALVNPFRNSPTGEMGYECQ